MKRLLAIPLIFGLVLAILTIGPDHASAGDLADRFAGSILLDVEQHGEAWYVYPDTKKRRYLGRPDDAFEVMRYKGMGISNKDLARIPKNADDKPDAYEQELRERLSGHILLQVEKNGEAWYVNPANKKRYFLGRPADAFTIMSGLGQGVASDRLPEIPLTTEQTPLWGKVRHDAYHLGYDRGQFDIHVVSIPRRGFEMVTDTADLGDCGANCPAWSLKTFVKQNNAEIGINGTYFCEADASACAGQENRFSSPVYNSENNDMVNERELKTHVGPIMVEDTKHILRFYHRTKGFGASVNEFTNKAGAAPIAAISNYPSLVEDNTSVADSEPLSSSMRYSRLTRVGIGYRSDRFFIVIAKRATVPDLADIMQTLGAKYALNLDGGSSTALYLDGQYKFGPGRDIPNAVLFKRR